MRPSFKATLADYPGSLPSGLPLPDSLAIFVNLTDSVERNPPKLSGFIQKFKSAALAHRKHDLLKWDTVKPAFLSIPIADLKLASAKFLVVTDSAEQFVDGRHADDERWCHSVTASWVAFSRSLGRWSAWHRPKLAKHKSSGRSLDFDEACDRILQPSQIEPEQVRRCSPI